MKLKSRLLSALLALAMVATSLGVLTFGGVASAATFPDVDASKSYYQSVDLLSALDIIQGYEDGSFGPDLDVTRAEFTVMLMRSMGLSGIGDSNPANLPFSDCSNPGFSWAIADISTAASQGIINGMGDGTFAPDEQVTYDQAVKMVVCALGYEVAALEKVGNDPTKVFPNGYIGVAVDNNMLTDVNGTIDVPAKRWQIAQLLYNAMDVDLLERIPGVDGNDRYVVREGQTMLSSMLKVYYDDGVLTADNMESIRPNGATARDGQVYIQLNTGEEIYVYTEGLSTSGMVGHNVRFYYNQDINGDKTLVHLVDRTNSSNILDIDASDIEGTPTGDSEIGFTIKYWANDTDKNASTATTSAGTTVVVNGRTVTGMVTGGTLKPLDGSLQLMDSNRDGVYETVFVSKYDTYVVNTKNNTAQTITSLYTSEVLSLNEDEAKVTITNTSGKTVAFSALKKYDVLSVRESTDTNGKPVREVTVSTQQISGMVNGLDELNSIVQIGNTDYIMSNFFLKNYVNKDGQMFSLDDEGVFYLDKDGKIAAFTAEATAASNYGYLVQTEVTNERLRVKLLPAKSGSSFVVYTSGSKIKIDRESKDAEDAQAALERICLDERINIDYDGTDGNTKDDMLTTEVGLAPQLVRYTLNGGQIDSIDTVLESASEASSTAQYLTPEQLVYDLSDAGNPVMKYNSTLKEFSSDAGSSFRVSTSTVFVVVPHDRGDMDDYSAKSINYLRNNAYYTVEAYDVESGYAKAVVLYETENIDATVHATSPSLFVTGYSVKMGDNGPVTVLTGYLAGTSGVEEAEVVAESDTAVSGVQVGDVIRYGVDNKGQIMNGTVQIVVSAAAGIQELTPGSFSDVQYDTSTDIRSKAYEAAIGYAFRAGEDNILDVALTDDPAAIADAKQSSVVATSATRLLYYNSDNKTVTDETESLLRDDSTGTSKVHIGIETYDATLAETKVFVLTMNEALRVIYVID